MAKTNVQATKLTAGKSKDVKPKAKKAKPPVKIKKGNTPKVGKAGKAAKAKVTKAPKGAYQQELGFDHDSVERPFNTESDRDELPEDGTLGVETDIDVELTDDELMDLGEDATPEPEDE